MSKAGKPLTVLGIYKLVVIISMNKKCTLTFTSRTTYMVRTEREANVP